MRERDRGPRSCTVGGCSPGLDECGEGVGEGGRERAVVEDEGRGRQTGTLCGEAE